MGKALSIFVILGLCGSARADGPVAAAKAVLAAQTTHEGDAFGKTFAADGFLLLDGHAVIGPDAIGEAYGSSDTVAPAIIAVSKVKPTHLAVGAIGDGAAWLTADLVFSGDLTEGLQGTSSKSSWTVPISELIVKDGDGWKVKAAQIAMQHKDKDVKNVLSDGPASPEPIPDAKDDADHASALGLTALVAALGTDKAVAVIGSAPKEHTTGAAKVKKLLKKWAKLPFTVNGGVRWVDGDGWSYAAARVDLAAGDVTIPYDVLVIFSGTSVVSVHYGLAGSFI